VIVIYQILNVYVNGILVAFERFLDQSFLFVFSCSFVTNNQIILGVKIRFTKAFLNGNRKRTICINSIKQHT
jgi:hypothetical protein